MSGKGQPGFSPRVPPESRFLPLRLSGPRGLLVRGWFAMRGCAAGIILEELRGLPGLIWTCEGGSGCVAAARCALNSFEIRVQMDVIPHGFRRFVSLKVRGYSKHIEKCGCCHLDDGNIYRNSDHQEYERLHVLYYSFALYIFSNHR